MVSITLACYQDSFVWIPLKKTNPENICHIIPLVRVLSLISGDENRIPCISLTLYTYLLFLAEFCMRTSVFCSMTIPFQVMNSKKTDVSWKVKSKHH